MISALSIDHLLTRESSAPDELLFHYTSRESLRTILESGNLRLNTLDRINDPRERSEWIADKIVIPPGGHHRPLSRGTGRGTRSDRHGSAPGSTRRPPHV